MPVHSTHHENNSKIDWNNFLSHYTYHISDKFKSFIGGIEYAGNKTFHLNASKSNTAEADFRPVPLSQVYNHHFTACDRAKSEASKQHLRQDQRNKENRQKSQNIEEQDEGVMKQWVRIVMSQKRI